MNKFMKNMQAFFGYVPETRSFISGSNFAFKGYWENSEFERKIYYENKIFAQAAVFFNDFWISLDFHWIFIGFALDLH